MIETTMIVVKPPWRAGLHWRETFWHIKRLGPLNPWASENLCAGELRLSANVLATRPSMQITICKLDCELSHKGGCRFRMGVGVPITTLQWMSWLLCPPSIPVRNVAFHRPSKLTNWIRHGGSCRSTDPSWVAASGEMGAWMSFGRSIVGIVSDAKEWAFLELDEHLWATSGGLRWFIFWSPWVENSARMAAVRRILFYDARAKEVLVALDSGLCAKWFSKWGQMTATGLKGCFTRLLSS